ncbi:hypothetical protein FQN55_006800 [Onygenales sp. PD_40]|nr:hypothetical protein FQN55_006800 [Onygenales sp. PD_40]KAK2791306.1 hypothetical protein FQN52_004983 [Onygenales sp. PD_12]
MTQSPPDPPAQPPPLTSAENASPSSAFSTLWPATQVGREYHDGVHAAAPLGSGGDVETVQGGGPATVRGTPEATPTPRIRRRNRMITSCLECRRRKLKCDRLHPCTNCSKFKRDCLFLAPAMDSDARRKLTELKDKMGSLERVLEQDAAARKTGHQEGGPLDNDDGVDSNTLVGMLESSSEAQAPVPEDEKDLKPTPLAVEDAAYEDGSDDDDTYDLGFKLGKMRMTDRVGGFYRPRIADELSHALRHLNVSDGPENQPLPLAKPKPPRVRDLMPKTTQESYFSPGPSYIAPRSDSFFGGGPRKYSLADFLPGRAVADALLKQYWEGVEPVAKVVHRPTFEKQYDMFWQDISRGFEPPYSLQATVFAALFSAVISLPEATILNSFGVSQKDLTENFQLATEMALAKANFLKTTKTQTLQALVMYMIPMCRAEVSRAHSVLVGTAIRLAECMGLHRDPDEYGLGPIETHVRRMIWYQLCFLDLRTSETQGPRQTIRREDFSTKFPLNVDDAELGMPSSLPLADRPQWTDMTFTRMRFECHEMHRLIYVDRMRIEKKAVSLTHVLGKIEAFRKATMAKYGPLIHVPNPRPIQRAAQLVLSILTCRAYIAVLHRYHNTVTVRIPDRLRQIIITSGTQLLEDAIELETNPDLKTWAWYSGAVNQYHTAFLLLFDIFQNPMRKEADRIWRCLDYVFECPPSPLECGGEKYRDGNRQALIAHRAHKARVIFAQLHERMIAYREIRRLKIPVSMQVPAVDRGSSDTIVATKPSPGQTEPSKPGKEEGGGAPSFPLGVSMPQSPPVFPPGVGVPSPQHISPRMAAHNQQSEPYPQPHAQNPLPTLPQWQQQQPQPLTPPQHAQALSQPQSQPVQPYQPYNYGQFQNLRQPPYIPPDYGGRGARGRSLDSETTSSDDSGTPGLWFLPGAGTASAGLAPPASSMVNAKQGAPQGPPNEDLPMLDIDWKL